MAIAWRPGSSASSAFLVGIAVSLSSTAVVIRVLADRSETDSVHGLVATGMLITQDVVVVLVLLLDPAAAGQHGGRRPTASPSSWAIALGKLVGARRRACSLVERVVMRRLFLSAAFAGARELLAVSSLTVSLGAIGACWALDLSPALGGFIAGIVMADAAVRVAGAQRDRTDPHGPGRGLLRLRRDARRRAVDGRTTCRSIVLRGRAAGARQGAAHAGSRRASRACRRARRS